MPGRRPLLVFEQCRQVVDRQRPQARAQLSQRECGVVEFLGDLRNRHVPGGGCRLLRRCRRGRRLVLAGRHRVEGEPAGSRAALGVLGAVGIVDVRFTVGVEVGAVLVEDGPFGFFLGAVEKAEGAVTLDASAVIDCCTRIVVCNT
ncbi:hypothetical protein GS944_14345 [Rhodococcus hoagii]|nr:hypothetical protein [Prescottella equi]